MEIPVLIEPLNENGYRAIGAGGLSLGLAAEGETRQEAIDKLGRLVQARLAQRAEVIPEKPCRRPRTGGSRRC